MKLAIFAIALYFINQATGNLSAVMTAMVTIGAYYECVLLYRKIKDNQ